MYYCTHSSVLVEVLFQVLSLNKFSKILPPSPPILFIIHAVTLCSQWLRFLQFFDQLAECLGEMFELSNTSEASFHCKVKVTRCLFGRPGEFV
jgi:hypothetical protein